MHSNVGEGLDRWSPLTFFWTLNNMKDFLLLFARLSFCVLAADPLQSDLNEAMHNGLLLTRVPIISPASIPIVQYDDDTLLIISLVLFNFNIWKDC